MAGLPSRHVSDGSVGHGTQVRGVLLPQMLPVEQDLWWQQSQIIPLFKQFEGWGIELYYTIKSLIWE